MIDWLNWFFTNPVPFGCFCYVVGVMAGFIVGQSAKTRPVEIERDKARSELASVLTTIELTQESVHNTDLCNST